MKRVMAFTLGIHHPSARLRIAAYREAFLRENWALQMHAFDPGMGKALPAESSRWQRTMWRCRRAWRSHHAAAVLRALAPDSPIIISRELPVRRRPFLDAPHPLVLDVDDALYLGESRAGFDALCKRADAVVCGNETIAAEIRPLARRCVVIPTVVNPAQYVAKQGSGGDAPLRLGWLGSSMSLSQTLLPAMAMLANLQRELGFALVVIADACVPDIQRMPWVRFVRWSEAVETRLAEHMDVGIMPLENTPYQAGKCGAKLLQYMAAALPAIATPVGVNREIVLQGATGFLATDAAQWRDAIAALAGSASLRCAMGRAGRERVEQHYSIGTWAPVWLKLLQELAGAPGRATSARPIR